MATTCREGAATQRRGTMNHNGGAESVVGMKPAEWQGWQGREWQLEGDKTGVPKPKKV
jgi:hypothetical protein